MRTLLVHPSGLMLWRFGKVYNGDRQLADHQRPIRCELPRPSQHFLVPGPG